MILRNVHDGRLVLFHSMNGTREFRGVILTSRGNCVTFDHFFVPYFTLRPQLLLCEKNS